MPLVIIFTFFIGYGMGWFIPLAYDITICLVTIYFCFFSKHVRQQEIGALIYVVCGAFFIFGIIAGNVALMWKHPELIPEFVFPSFVPGRL